MGFLSIQEKIRKIGKLTPSDLSEWETQFVSDIKARAEVAAASGQITGFSERQVEVIDRLYSQHFG